MPITIVSPGVEVIENDMSLRAVIPAGTNVTVPVFANQGPTGEVISISTISEFEDIFGMPTNSAELYGYATVSQVVNSAAKVSVIRVPYGRGSGDTKSKAFTVLGYPAVGYKLDKTSAGDPTFTAISKFSEGSTVTGYEGSATIILGEPVQFTMSIENYYNFISGRKLDGSGDFEWQEDILTSVPTTSDDLGQFALLVVNIDKTVTNDGYEGFYLGLSDNAFSDPGETYESITAIKTVTEISSNDENGGITGTDYLTIPSDRLDFKLSSAQKGCISQIMQESINSFDISSNKWNDTLNFGIFKIRQSTASGDALKLSALLTKGYNAAIQSGRKATSADSISAVDSFVENVSRDRGAINVFVNPYLSGTVSSRGLFPNGDPKIKVRVLTQHLINSAPTIITAAEAASASDEGKTVSATTIAEAATFPIGIDKATVASITTIKAAGALYPLGLYSNPRNTTKIIGNLPAKIKDALAIVANDELFDVDLVLEGGMGTIYVGAMDAAYQAYAAAENSDELPDNLTDEETAGKYIEDKTIFDDSKIIAGVDHLRTSRTSLTSEAEQIITNFKAVGEAFRVLATSQADGGRGDTFFIGDGLRHICVEGRDTKIEKKYKMTFENGGDEPGMHSFSSSIYWPLRHLFSGVATSYMAVYPHFLKMQHPVANLQYWAPASGAVAAKIAATDNKVGPWQAAAGITNGVLSGVLDISFSTTQRQRDDLYKISLNPIISTSEAVQVYGIRTMIRTASSFDQITVRRLFLYINKLLRVTAKQFLFEGNTDFTRLRVIQTLKPVFDDLVTKRALYDYLLVCDTRNNTAQIINDGILQIDFYGSGTRTAERISVGVTATKYGADLTELAGS